MNVVNDAAVALSDKTRTIRESAISEVVVGALGAGVGGAASFAALYGLGVTGLSAAGITSGLATAGAIVGGGMVAGTFVLAAPIAVLAAGGVGIATHRKNKQLQQEKERLYQEALRKHQAIIQALKEESMAAKYVDGLSAYYHRLLSLGHDPLLGFIFGVLDILTGRMTTIDKTGKIVSQVVKGYADRKESNVFAAIAKQIIHLKSDITTSMGLPVPMMSLFNFLQFGSIGEEEQTIAEIVQGMYYEGYDFIHFCSMSIPAMIVEVAVRFGYAFKRLKEGHTIKESIPLSLNRTTHPKLVTMLFVGHSASTAINAGKVYFIGNPLAINYPQWLAFAKYSYKQLKWAIMDKPRLRDAYVQGKISERLCEVYEDIDDNLKEYVVVFEE